MAAKDVSWGPGNASPGGGTMFAPWAQEGRQRGAWPCWVAAADPQATAAGAPISLRRLSGVTGLFPITFLPSSPLFAGWSGPDV